jgi:hypothetical protein
MVMIIITFTLYLITKLLLIPKPMQKVLPFCFELDGRDIKFSVDVAEGISAPEEEAPPSPPPIEGDVSDMNKDDLPSSDDIRVAFTAVTPLDTLPPGTSFLLQNPTPP